MNENLEETRESSDQPPMQVQTGEASQQSPVVPPYVWQGKLGPAFWTVASVLSLTVNLILILVLIILGRQLFALKGLITDQLIGGLYDNFVSMDDASIMTTIAVNDTIQVVDTIKVVDTIPVVFDLPLAQDTTVILTTETPVNGTTIYLNGSAVPIDLVLPAGTALNIRLDMVVPVSQTVPVELDVPVDLEVPVALNVPVNIPLNKTELHQPFVGLQNVVSPYQKWLGSLPDSWEETPLCGSMTIWFCRWLFDLK